MVAAYIRLNQAWKCKIHVNHMVYQSNCCHSAWKNYFVGLTWNCDSWLCTVFLPGDQQRDGLAMFTRPPCTVHLMVVSPLSNSCMKRDSHIVQERMVGINIVVIAINFSSLSGSATRLASGWAVNTHGQQTDSYRVFFYTGPPLKS